MSQKNKVVVPTKVTNIDYPSPNDVGIDNYYVFSSDEDNRVPPETFDDISTSAVSFTITNKSPFNGKAFELGNVEYFIPVIVVSDNKYYVLFRCKDKE